MEFKTFLNAVMQLPAQLVLAGRRIILRLLSWNRRQSTLRGFVGHCVVEAAIIDVGIRTSRSAAATNP